jgi:hypothetical protein
MSTHAAMTLPAPAPAASRSRRRWGRPHRSWKLDAATDVVRLRTALNARTAALRADVTTAARAAEARRHLHEVEVLLARRWSDLLTSSSIDAVYRNLHEAEVAVVATLDPAELEARTPYLVAKAQRVLPKTDPQRAAVEALASATDEVRATEQFRLEFAEATRAVYEVADSRYARMRRFRTNLRIVTFLMSLVLVALIALGMRSPSYVPLCFRPQATETSTIRVACPTSEVRTDDPAAGAGARGVLPGHTTVPGAASDDDVLLVAILGAVGGALSGALAVRRFRPPPFTPYNLPLQSFLLKVPVGALTAVGGLLLLRGQIVPGLSELDSQGQILAYALIFGFAQHLFTRYVDVHAEKLLLATPTRAQRAGNGAPQDDDDDGAAAER